MALVTQVVLEVFRRLEAGGPVCPVSEGERARSGHVEGRGGELLFSGQVLVEDDILSARKAGVGAIRVGRSTIISPLARDTAVQFAISVRRGE